MKQTVERWILEHYSKNRLNGERRHFEFHELVPKLFCTRREARAWAAERYAYFKRPDLRAEPHGWRMPKAVKVRVTIERKDS